MMMTTSPASFFGARTTMLLCVALLLLVLHHDDAAVLAIINLPYDLSLIPKECPDISFVGWYCGVFPALPKLGITTCAWVCYVFRPQKILKPGIAFQPTPDSFNRKESLGDFPGSFGFLYCFLPGGCENAGILSQCRDGAVDYYTKESINGISVPLQSGIVAPAGGYYVCSDNYRDDGEPAQSKYDISVIHTDCQVGVKFDRQQLPQIRAEDLSPEQEAFLCLDGRRVSGCEELPSCPCNSGQAWFCKDECNPLNGNPRNPNCPAIDNSAIAIGCGTSDLYFYGLWLCPTCPACTNGTNCKFVCPAPMLALLGGFGSSLPDLGDIQTDLAVNPNLAALEGPPGLDSLLSSHTSKDSRRASRKNCRSTLKKLRAAYVTNECTSSKKACKRKARKVIPKRFVCVPRKLRQLASSITSKEEAQPTFLDFPHPCWPEGYSREIDDGSFIEPPLRSERCLPSQSCSWFGED
ncbi:hypothetical protein RI054_11g55260 [Pseudoscourfieldia marina]